MDESTNAALAADLDTLLLRPFKARDANVSTVQFRRTLYESPPFLPIMLAGYLTPIQAWTILCAAICFCGARG